MIMVDEHTLVAGPAGRGRIFASRNDHVMYSSFDLHVSRSPLLRPRRLVCLSQTNGRSRAVARTLTVSNMGKVHGSLARAGKVKSQTPKVEKQEKPKQPRGRAHKRLLYNRRYVSMDLQQYTYTSASSTSRSALVASAA